MTKTFIAGVLIAFFCGLGLMSLVKPRPLTLQEARPHVMTDDYNRPSSIIKEHTWVKVENADGIKNGNGFDSYGDDCLVKKGAETAYFEGYVIYLENGYGTECGFGTLFKLSKPEPENSAVNQFINL